jgi:glycosyltransferase involved in cell wall biosynthesis
MQRPVVCTILANNYLAYARVFTRSFLDQHPDGQVWVLVVDRKHPSLRYDGESFQVVFAEELGIPGFLQLAFRYSILELSTAVKPWFLLYLHRRVGADRLCYFDPDILVTGDLGELYQRLGEADVLLTPHVTAPIEDRLVPGERDLLLSGIYNLGFLGVSFNVRTLPFLDWWHRRLYRECLHAVERGLFVDQKWMDFAPAFLPRAGIVHDPGYNVAYWNLMHRSLARRDGRWWVDGVPLRFFHFSGAVLDRPDVISRFQNRFSLADRPDVAPLFEEYRRLITAAGHAQLVHLPYAFGAFGDGSHVPPAARRLLQVADANGQRWPDPFATDGGDSFLAWLTQSEDAESPIRLPRIALAVWDQRPDLQQVFPSPDRRDRAAFARWFLDHGEEHEIADVFRRPVESSLRSGRRSSVSELVEMQHRVWHDLARREPLNRTSLSREDLDSLTSEAGPDPDRRPRVPRLALMLLGQRPDLKTSFPDPFGAHRRALALWFVTYGRLEYALPWSLVGPVLRTLDLRSAVWARLWWHRQRWRRAEAHRRRAAHVGEAVEFVRPVPVPCSGTAGINVVGWAAAPTGVGEACRSTLHALAEAKIPAALWSLGASAGDDFRSGAAGGKGGDGMPFDVTLFHVNADMMPVVCSELPRALLAHRYRIGYWFWELSHFPLEFARAFDHVDEVWAPSRFCAEAFQAIAPVPVRWVPPCAVPPRESPVSRAEIEVAAGSFLFLSVFDALSIPERKNPFALIEAFAQAVHQSRRPLHLLLKVSHLEPGSEFARRLHRAIKRLPVTLLARSLSRPEVNALTAACDAYVSLHRSEGLGLPLIEAMQLGKPVIATGYGGCTDFLDPTTGWVVRHSLVALTEPHGPYPPGAVWAEPNVDHACELMLEVAAGHAGQNPRLRAARQRVAELYSPAASATRLRRELARIVGVPTEAAHPAEDVVPVSTARRLDPPA